MVKVFPQLNMVSKLAAVSLFAQCTLLSMLILFCLTVLGDSWFAENVAQPAVVIMVW